MCLTFEMLPLKIFSLESDNKSLDRRFLCIFLNCVFWSHVELSVKINRLIKLQCLLHSCQIWLDPLSWCWKTLTQIIIHSMSKLLDRWRLGKHFQSDLVRCCLPPSVKDLWPRTTLEGGNGLSPVSWPLTRVWKGHWKGLLSCTSLRLDFLIHWFA